MRLILAGILFLFISNCGSNKNVINQDEKTKNIFLDASGVVLGSETEWFPYHVKEMVIDEEIIQNVGEQLLAQIIEGYSNQTGKYRVADTERDADVVLVINKLMVGQKRFTLNFVKPGPIFEIEIDADVTNKFGENFTVQKKVLANMAEINYPDDNFKWLSDEERGDTESQLNTFNVGLRKLYQNLFFEVFDISLQL